MSDDCGVCQHTVGLWTVGWVRQREATNNIVSSFFFLLLLLLFSCFFFLLFVVVVVLVPLFSFSPPPLSAKITKMNKYNPNFIQYPLKLLRNTHTLEISKQQQYKWLLSVVLHKYVSVCVYYELLLLQVLCVSLCIY